MQLRDYQTAAVDAAIGYMKQGGSAGLISAATGTGKSLIIASLIERVCKVKPDARVLVATHVAELLQQNCAKLLTLWPLAPCGIYSAGLGVRERRQITFAGIQSIHAVDWEAVNLLIVDEAHTISRKQKSMWASLINKLKDKNRNLKIIGLSATTFRMDSGNLCSGDDAMFDTIVFEYGLARAIQDGWLCGLSSKGTKTKYDVSGVGKVAGEFNLKELEAATNVDELTAQAVGEIIEYGAARRSWLMFCNGIAHSFAVRDEIRRRGYTCETVTGETPDYERMDILDRFQRGALRAVTNNAVWTTGIDVPNVDLIGMLRHTISGGLLLQMAGRGTRTVCNVNIPSRQERKAAIAGSHKPNCLFLDFAGNIQRHGFLDTITGRDKKKGEGIAPMKFCPQCAEICHAAATVCKECGHEFQVIAKDPIGDVYDGALFSNNEPELRPVLDVFYSVHNLNKPDKTPCLMVKYYHADGKHTREYVCLEHKGFAKTKALKWLAEHTEVKWDDSLSINAACQMQWFDSLKKPCAVKVVKEGKFERVVYRDFSKPLIASEASMLASMPDIEF